MSKVRSSSAYQPEPWITGLVTSSTRSTSSKAISNIKFDKVVVWENGGTNGRTNTANFLSGMANTLPPMMQVMRDIGGVELPESLVKVATDASAEAKGDGAPTAGAGPAPPPSTPR